MNANFWGFEIFKLNFLQTLQFIVLEVSRVLKNYNIRNKEFIKLQTLLLFLRAFYSRLLVTMQINYQVNLLRKFTLCHLELVRKYITKCSSKNYTNVKSKGVIFFIYILSRISLYLTLYTRSDRFIILKY